MLSRAENKDMIYPLIEEWTSQHTKMEIMEACQAEGCPVTAVFTVQEATQHPHIAERGGIVTLEHDALGTIRTLGAPFRLPECLGGPTAPAPLLGQHNDDVYGALGVDDAELASLRSQAII
jgi:crotonobetainyl-CoA:carnitine CoA-transferase CaiB-like acyl-CoA transferase